MRNFDEICEMFRNGETDGGVIASFAWNGEAMDSDVVSFIEKTAASRINKLLIKADMRPEDEAWLGRLESILEVANRNKIKVILQADEQKMLGRILAVKPTLIAKYMHCHVQHTYTDREIYVIPENAVSITAMEVRNGIADGDTAIDLRPLQNGSFIRYNAPSNRYQIFTVYYEEAEGECDCTDAFVAEYMMNMWEKLYSILPLFLRQCICGVCTTEMQAPVKLYSPDVCKEIKKSCGYDVTKLLAALFGDIGPITQQVRMDYGHVSAGLCKANRIDVLSKWLKDRKLDLYMLGKSTSYALDGAKYIYEIKERDEFYAEAVAAIRNGYSELVLTEHGNKDVLESSTSDITGEIVKCLNRLTIFATVGVRVADAAVLYPQSTVYGGEGEEKAFTALQSVTDMLKHEKILFDIVDEETFATLKAANGKLTGGEREYRMVILPALYSVKNAVLEKLVDFLKRGGMVVMLEEEPYASESGGRDNDVLMKYKKDLLGGKYSFTDGKGFAFCLDVEELGELLAGLKINRIESKCSVECLCSKTADAEYYMMFDAEKGEYAIKAAGDTSRLVPETGEVSRVYPKRQKSGVTTVKMPHTEGVYMLAFDSSKRALPVLTKGLSGVVSADGENAEVCASYTQCGEKRVFLQTAQTTYIMDAVGETEVPADEALDGLWLTRISNGDGRASAKLMLDRFRYKGQTVRAGEGVKFLLLGPFPEDADTVEIEREISTFRAPDAEDVYEVDGNEYRWSELSTEDDVVSLPQGRCYLWTAVKSENDDDIQLVSGYRPRRLYINGSFYDSNRRLRIKKGINNILMRFDSECQTYLRFVSLMYMESGPDNMLEYRYDPYPYREKGVCTLEAVLPPNASAIVIKAYSEPTLYIDGVKLTSAAPSDKAYRYVFGSSSDGKQRSLVIELSETDGCYGGGVLAGAAELYCRESVAELEALYGLECLETLDGLVTYEKSFSIDDGDVRVYLHCGEASGLMTLSVNNFKPVVVPTQNYKTDITEQVRIGNNKIVLTVYSPQNGKHLGLAPSVKLSFEKTLIIKK